MNYIIEYSIIDNNGLTVRSHKKMRAKNRVNEFDAKVRLEQFFIKKYSNFGQLIIHDCKIDNPFTDLSDGFDKKSDQFGGIFDGFGDFLK